MHVIWIGWVSRTSAAEEGGGHSSCIWCLAAAPTSVLLLLQPRSAHHSCDVPLHCPDLPPPHIHGATIHMNMQAPGALLTWMAQRCTTAATPSVLRVRGVHRPTPQARPLPGWTVLSLLDRRGAAVRGFYCDHMAQLLQSHGGLPAIVRRIKLQDLELLREELAPREWLWGHMRFTSNQTWRRHMPASEGGGRRGDTVRVKEHM